MMAPVPYVIHSHEPEPLAQLAKQVQEPGTPQAVTRLPHRHCLTLRLAKTK
jgi:hypothetical protein